MIKAVFFDWYDTLVQSQPPRNEMHAAACRQFNIEIDPASLRRGILAADRFYRQELSRSPLEERSPEAQAEVYARYEQVVLAEAGIKVPRELALSIVTRARELFRSARFVLFDDVLPTLTALRARGLTLGMISNVERDILPICQEVGLTPRLDFIVTSLEVGVDKPHPPIFLAALKKAGVEASEAIHIGDQYEWDVVGARQVGIKGLLLDRHNIFPEITDCPRLRTLTEVLQHL
jgi:putative hydrolase of the HAD superfamily